MNKEKAGTISRKLFVASRLKPKLTGTVISTKNREDVHTSTNITREDLWNKQSASSRSSTSHITDDLTDLTNATDTSSTLAGDNDGAPRPVQFQSPMQRINSEAHRYYTRTTLHTWYDHVLIQLI